ncbi:MAG: hypothetical protein ABI947_14990 [Chloroflexota bacterium]
MADTRRIPFVLNLDDPIDAAIWQALEPLLTRHRASAFIRGAVAHALGVGGLMPALVPLGLPAGEIRAKRPTLLATVDQDMPEAENNGDDLEAAAGNFMSMFG